jgi:hypothetical protein
VNRARGFSLGTSKRPCRHLPTIVHNSSSPLTVRDVAHSHLKEETPPLSVGEGAFERTVACSYFPILYLRSPAAFLDDSCLGRSGDDSPLAIANLGRTSSGRGNDGAGVGASSRGSSSCE